MNRLILLLAVVLLLLPSAAQAHKLGIFAWPEGGEIRGEVKFSGGRKAKNVQIAVRNAADQAVLAETACDENGTFRFPLPPQALNARPDLLIVADSGEGHRGEWLLESQGYAPAGEAAAASAAPAKSAVPAADSAEFAVQTVAAAAPSAGISEQQFRRIVAEELNKGLSPIRQSIAASLIPEPSLRDILGGIGWLFGLAGMAAWAQSRRTKKN